MITSVAHSSVYSPGATTAQTFKTQFANSSAAALVSVQLFTARSSMVLMEVAS
jgi:hypothetical protein